MKKISQLKMKGYYRNALTLKGLDTEHRQEREWFIRNRRAPVEKGFFALRVNPIKTVTVDLNLLRERIERMSKTQRRRFMSVMKGCTCVGKSFRVDVFPRIS